MKSILFSTPMVQAIPDGRKTQTRRIIKAPVMRNVREPDSVLFDGKACKFRWFGDDVIGGFGIMPKYQPDDILWVRETTYLYGRWQRNGFTKTGKQKYKFTWDKTYPVIYAADGKPEYVCKGKDEIGYFKRPSIFMPCEAARIFLRVTNVRVERLQEITEEDCYGEGYDYKCPYEHRVAVGDPYYGDGYEGMCWSEGDCHNPDKVCDMSIPEHFGRTIWDSIYLKRGYGWETNPWVWVYEFERVSEIDQS